MAALRKDAAYRTTVAVVLAALAVTAPARAAPAGQSPSKPAATQALGRQARDAAVARDARPPPPSRAGADYLTPQAWLIFLYARVKPSRE